MGEDLMFDSKEKYIVVDEIIGAEHFCTTMKEVLDELSHLVIEQNHQSEPLEVQAKVYKLKDFSPIFSLVNVEEELDLKKIGLIQAVEQFQE